MTRRGRTYKSSAHGVPPPPPRPDSTEATPIPPPPPSEKKVEVEFTADMRRTMAERLTDAESQIYNGWAALADNDGYRLNEMERRGMVDSYDMLLQLYGAEWGGKMLAIIMFSAAHVTPMMCRILVKPRKGSVERANKMVADVRPIRPETKRETAKGAAVPPPSSADATNARGKVERAAPSETKEEDDDEEYDGGDD